MSKFIKSIICIVGTCALFLGGCSNGVSEKEAQTNKEEKAITSSEKIENENRSDSSEKVENENKIDSSDDNTNTHPTKQIYLEKLSKLEANLETSLKEKYASPVTQDMIDAANEEFKQWDYMLNEAYAELEKQLSKEEMDKLTDEELNWIKSRDEKSEAAANEFKGGTMEPLNRVMSLAASTKERCFELVNKYMK